MRVCLSRKLLYLVVAMGILVLAPTTTMANDNYYGIAENLTSNIHGTYFYATIRDMDSKWSTTHNERFILHTIWIADGDKWIEVGFMDGAIAEPGGQIEFHRGYYTATGDKGNIPGTYREYKILGPSTSIGTNHAFHIQRDGSTSWGVYVDFILRRTYSNFAHSANKTSVGLETNTLASTSAEWNQRAFQIYVGGHWSNWTSGKLWVSPLTGISVAWATQYRSTYTSKQ